MTDDSRARILRAALALFVERGYYTVSVREIAEMVGLTKTAVLYHFPSKRDIVVALVEPLLTDTEAVLESTRAIDDAQVRRWAVVEGLMDTWLRHGQLLRMQMRDRSLAADDATYARLRDIALAAQEVIAGPDADLTARVRAAQVYAALSDPVVIFANLPEAQLRAAILDGVRRLVGAPPERTAVRAERPVDAPVRRSHRGRPGSMTTDMVASARRMLDRGEHSVAEVAADFGVSRATLYRYLTVRADRPDTEL